MNSLPPDSGPGPGMPGERFDNFTQEKAKTPMRYICIHGHFYQPPRENPWLEAIEQQDSAYPFHDWNERIAYECYAPNTASRVLGREWKIVDIVNNYSRMSFNFGPTLLSWLEKKAPGTYQAVLAGDRLARERFSGHGTALAQVYNHMIMPLACSRDKRTQVIWGVRDFERRFGRRPEGMWLAETAVDIESLELMAECGIAFTILAPGQAARIRRLGETEWQEVANGSIDPKRPYLCRLPSGAAIALFFYDGPISRDLAFSDLLDNGERFAKRLSGAFVENTAEAQLVHIATDGETYGHHRRFGDMALAYCLRQIEKSDPLQLTVYGEFLEKFPPRYEVQIRENTSWSCSHGVERWRSDCGCNSGSHPGWNQRWRRPLRDGLDRLRDRLGEIFQREGKKYLRDPWRARDDYIQVVLDRSAPGVERFFQTHQVRELDPGEKQTALKLLEMARNGMLMFTSCGWFFDEISGIEPVQIIKYAARAIQLAAETGGENLEEEFLGYLGQAVSNIPECGDGRWIYSNFVRPAVVDLMRVGAHYAVISLFDELPEEKEIYAFRVISQSYEHREAGKQKCAVGRVRVVSLITREELVLDFVSLYLGNHNLIAAVEPGGGDGAREEAGREILAAFDANNIPEVIRAIDRHFRQHNYTLWHLFREEQRAVIGQIIADARAELEGVFRQLYRHHYPVIQVLKRGDFPLPGEMEALENFVLNVDLRQVLEAPKVNVRRLQELVSQLRQRSRRIDRPTLEFVVNRRVEEMMEEIASDPEDLAGIRHLTRVLKTVRELPVKFDLWEAQNTFFRFAGAEVPLRRRRGESGDEEAAKWLRTCGKLGDQLRVSLPGEA